MLLNGIYYNGDEFVFKTYDVNPVKNAHKDRFFKINNFNKENSILQRYQIPSTEDFPIS